MLILSGGVGDRYHHDIALIDEENSMAERAFLKLFVSSALACSLAQAQTPNPPVLMGGELPPASPSRIIFSDGFEEHELGEAEVTNGWKIAKGGSTATLRIEDNNPLCEGCGKYLRSFATKKDLEVYRVEYVYTDEPSNNEMVSLGAGDYRGKQTYWYGYLWALDQYPPDQDRVHFIQMWMKLAPPPQDQSLNPQISLIGNAEGLFLSFEDHDDLPGGLGYTSPQLAANPLGKCYQMIWKVRADTRTAAEGGQGEFALYINGANVYSFTNKQVMQDRQVGLHHDFRIGGYLSGWRWDPPSENGQAYEARWDNWTVMDETGSLAAMQQAVGTCS